MLLFPAYAPYLVPHHFRRLCRHISFEYRKQLSFFYPYVTVQQIAKADELFRQRLLLRVGDALDEAFQLAVLADKCFDELGHVPDLLKHGRKQPFFFCSEMQPEVTIVKLHDPLCLPRPVMSPAVRQQCFVTLFQPEREGQTMMMIVRKSNKA
jgi:hypothetical protein